MTTSMQTTTHTKSLRHDEDGAVLMIGVVMMIFLIGAIWAVMGIGNAINHREQMQMGADAAAFASAVYDARGMNIIAMINLVMAAILAILVAMRMVEILALVLIIATCAFGCEGVAFLPELEQFDQTVNEVATTINDVLTALNITESLFGLGWPWLAAEKGSYAVQDYQPDVDGAIVVSGSQFEGLDGAGGTHFNFNYGDLVSEISNAPFGTFFDKKASAGSKVGAGLTGLYSNYGGKFGLPIQNAPYQDVCAMASRTVLHAGGPLFFLDLLDVGPAKVVIDPLIHAIENTVDYVVGNLSFFFCDSDVDGFEQLVSKLTTIANNKGKGGGKGGNLPLPGGQSTKVALPNFSGPTTSSTKMLYSNASWGDDNFAIWSVAAGTARDPLTHGVQVAALLHPPGQTGATTVGALPPDASTSYAKAEFYYEPKPGDDAQGLVSSTWLGGVITSSNCMWNMRWRARMRRFHEMQGQGNAYFDNLLGNVISNILPFAGQFGSDTWKNTISGLTANQNVNQFTGMCSNSTSGNPADVNPIWYLVNPIACGVGSLSNLPSNLNGGNGIPSPFGNGDVTAAPPQLVH